MVIATGGLSIPKIGATDFGYRIARQFGLRIVEPRPALVPLTFDGESWAPYSQLAGLSLPVAIETGAEEGSDVLSRRPAVHAPRPERARGAADLQLLAPGASPSASTSHQGTDLYQELARAKATSRKLIANELAAYVPSRLADAWVQQDSRLAAARERSQRQGAGGAGRAPGALGTAAQRHAKATRRPR